MKLFLMRHGEAGWNATSDAERVLTPAGIAGVKLVLEGNMKILADVSAVVSSPYRRACQTASLMSEHLAVPLLSPDAGFTPDAPLSLALSQLEQLPWAGLLLVAHQPLLGDLVATLVTGETRSPEPMAPATIAILELDWPAAGLARLVAKLEA